MKRSLIPLGLHPLLRWRMARRRSARRGDVGTRRRGLAPGEAWFRQRLLRAVEQAAALASGDIAEHRLARAAAGGVERRSTRRTRRYLFCRSGALTPPGGATCSACTICPSGCSRRPSWRCRPPTKRPRSANSCDRRAGAGSGDAFGSARLFSFGKSMRTNASTNSSSRASRSRSRRGLEADRHISRAIPSSRGVASDAPGASLAVRLAGGVERSRDRRGLQFRLPHRDLHRRRPARSSG